MTTSNTSQQIENAVTRSTPLELLPQWLTVQEVQSFLGLGRTSTYGLIASGDIPSKRFGKRVFVPRRALEFRR